MNTRSTDNMSQNQLTKELEELERAAQKGELTPNGAARMTEVKQALARIQHAMRLA